MEILGLVDVPLYLLLALTAIVLTYTYATWNYDYFKKRCIPGPTPYPFIGSSFSFSLFSNFPTWKQTYGSVFGVFIGKVPALVISDLDILNVVFVKSFNVFRNRMRSIIIPYPFNLAVVYLENAHWKRVRNLMTPTFSTAKLRLMCFSINNSAKTLSKNLSDAVKNNEVVITRQFFEAFTMDVISRIAFGIKIDSQNEVDNPFVAHAKQMFELSNMRRLTSMMAGTFPFSFTTVDALDFMSLKKRIDFLQLLVDAEIEMDRDLTANGQITEKHTARRLSTDEIVAQGMLFFIAGYETTAATLTFVSYSFAMNQDAQEKAYNEIKEVLGNDEPNYDNIGKLKYLDNVITETLRLYPPITVLHRRASETIQIKGLTIPKGQIVLIPTFALHRDPRLFKDPDSFKPERHDEKYNPLTFLAFGYGPRKCIGMRLAQVQSKIALVHVLRAVKFERMPDTPEVLMFKRSNVLQTDKSIALKISPRC
ncbi:cytochrome P450 3A8-like [Haliotis rubra]|uniref:cytochrome P450 3A8-like n=1 Tax=Haliotis rubra TaxID=36100 RepID=UPI001EE5A5C3|nr:cytochrome P450 3A8-like [Haliotis rubra]